MWQGYRPAAHHRLIADKLQLVEAGKLKRLMIFMPPRHGKSMLASEYFPSWYLGRNPDKQIMTATYGQELANDFGRKVRNLMQDKQFQAIFPKVKIRQDSSAAHRFHICRRGVYQGVGVGGAATGRGADLLLIDDPIKNQEDAESDTMRRKLKDWYASVAYTRLMPGGAIVLIQTRWHHDDLAGWLLAEHAHENWDVLSLPAVTSSGQALWPEAYPLSELRKIEKAIGSRAWSALYQQQPSPDEGGILRKQWWRKWPQSKDMPESLHVIQSWDTAYSDRDHANSSYSARTTWAIFQDGARHGMMLLEAWKDRVDYPTLRKLAQESFMKWRPDRVLIEKKASGQSLIQDLRRSGVPVSTYQPDKDKVTRAYAVSAMLESGQIHYPDRRWAEAVIDECAQFPTGAHDDYVDTCSQAWLWLRNGWWLQHPQDPKAKPAAKHKIRGYA